MSSIAIETSLQKWGNSLGLRVTGAMKDIPFFTENTPVTVEVFADGFIVKHSSQAKPSLLFSEAELLADLDTRSVELVAQPKLNQEWET